MQQQSFLDWNYMIQSIPQVALGVPISLSIACIAFLFGIVIGFFLALAKIYKTPVVYQFAAIYVSFMRGTPLLVQIFLAYYGVPMLLQYLGSIYGWKIDVSQIPALNIMYICYSLNVGAYLSETIRSSILSVPNGQVEAALSLGMTTPQLMRRIVIPQAAKVAIPNMGNTFISLLKDTSLAFAASVPEIIGQAQIAASRSSKFFEEYIVAAALYWIICIFLGRLLNFCEGRMRRHERGINHD